MTVQTPQEPGHYPSAPPWADPEPAPAPQAAAPLYGGTVPPYDSPDNKHGQLLVRFPGRRFVFVGDAGSGTHEVARSCQRYRARRTRVSKLHPDAYRFAPPPSYDGKGRPRSRTLRRAPVRLRRR